MSQPVECMIGLDKQFFYSGQSVSGKVIVYLHSPAEIRNLFVELEGEAYCHWTEAEGSGNNKRDQDYTGKEELLKLSTYVVGDPSGQNNAGFYPVGNYTFPFSFTLPINLPSSAEEDFGHVKYVVKATIDQGWNFVPNVQQTVIIKESIDTNHPSYQTPTGGAVSKPIGCCCFPSGILSLNANLNSSAYCSGETIFMDAIVQNKSTSDMRAMKAKLMKKVEYHAQNRMTTKTDVTVVKRVQGPPIPGGQSREFASQRWDIPLTAPSVLNCNIIKISYELCIYVDVPYGFDLDLKIPIILGTIPKDCHRETDVIWPGSLPCAPPMESTFNLPAPVDAKSNLIGPGMSPPPSYDSVYGMQPANGSNYTKEYK